MVTLICKLLTDGWHITNVMSDLRVSIQLGKGVADRTQVDASMHCSDTVRWMNVYDHAYITSVLTHTLLQTEVKRDLTTGL
jgi:hypothetical protein